MSGSYLQPVSRIEGVTVLSELAYPKFKQVAPLLSQLDIPIFYFTPAEHAKIEVFEQALIALAAEIEERVIAEHRRVTADGWFLFSRGLIIVINPSGFEKYEYKWELPSILAHNNDLPYFTGADEFRYYNLSRMLANRLS